MCHFQTDDMLHSKFSLVMLKSIAMSRKLVLALKHPEMAENYYFIEHTEDYLNVFVWVAPGSHVLT